MLAAAPAGAAENGTQPVTPGASPAASRLLEYLYRISGKQTLVGQHCAPLIGSTRLVVVERTMKHYPALFGQDFGFDAAGAWDGINFRQRIVDEAIRRHDEGFVITLMWHAVRPTEDEPVTFRDSIQGELTEAEWTELITPGTRLHQRWQAQVDVIAWFLKQLQAADIPVLWRPYHEMNGEWFWWGKKPGEQGYRRLYRMLFERFVYFHGLKNLLWVFNANEVRQNVDPYAPYFPGAEVVDVLATDVYRSGFATLDYESLLALAGDKPIALGEVGRPPSPEILHIQPRWTWFMVWGDLPPPFLPEAESIPPIYECAETLTFDELPWVEIGRPAIHYPVLR